MLYPNVYGARCVAIFGMPSPGYEEGFWNNTVRMKKGEEFRESEERERERERESACVCVREKEEGKKIKSGGYLIE